MRYRQKEPSSFARKVRGHQSSFRLKVLAIELSLAPWSPGICQPFEVPSCKLRELLCISINTSKCQMLDVKPLMLCPSCIAKIAHLDDKRAVCSKNWRFRMLKVIIMLWSFRERSARSFFANLGKLYSSLEKKKVICGFSPENNEFNYWVSILVAGQCSAYPFWFRAHIVLVSSNSDALHSFWFTTRYCGCYHVSELMLGIYAHFGFNMGFDIPLELLCASL